jgi:hypothetical protein
VHFGSSSETGKNPADLIDRLGLVVVCDGSKDRLPYALKWGISPPFSIDGLGYKDFRRVVWNMSWL